MPVTLAPLAFSRNFSRPPTLPTSTLVAGRENPVVVSAENATPGIAIDPSARRSAPVMPPEPSRATEPVSASPTSLSVELAQVLWMVVAVTTGLPAGSE